MKSNRKTQVKWQNACTSRPKEKGSIGRAPTTEMNPPLEQNHASKKDLKSSY